MHPRLQRVVEERDFVQQPGEPRKIAGLWEKALRGLSDARLPGNSVEDRSPTPTSPLSRSTRLC